MHILNGRTLGDLRGDYTCIQPLGSSVVDYFIVSPTVDNQICHMSILPFTIFSDHRPISLKLNFLAAHAGSRKSLEVEYEKAPLRYKYSNSSRNDFKTAQDNDTFVTMLNDISSKHYSQESTESEIWPKPKPKPNVGKCFGRRNRSRNRNRNRNRNRKQNIFLGFDII